MAKQKSFTLRVFLLLSLIVCSRAAEDFAAIAKSSFPSVQADKFIRDLNLFPKHDVNIIQRPDEAQSPTLKKLVEKPLRFPNLLGNATDDVSVEDLGHHAGYFNIEHSYAAKMFYFFFESRSSKEDPVVIWLTGGPGCSSELAIFYENGPFSIADNMSLVWNEFGWDQASNLIYVDQPTGTGFSYSTDRRDIRHNEDGVSNDLYDFLQGFAIGNGLTDPAVQYKAYPDFAAMLVDWMRNLEVGIPELLEDGIKMLIYAGEYDLICNWLGNSRWVHAMEWSGQKEFVSSPEISFEVDGSEAGVLKTHGPLAFLKVHNAGHMVPMDQPKAALEMLKRWTQGEISDAPVNKLNPEKLVAEF
ncbi:Serine carboxypeptidase-like 49 [Linum grandiflorum]